MVLKPENQEHYVLRPRTGEGGHLSSSRNGQSAACLFCPDPQRDWGSPTHMGEGTFFPESTDLNIGLAKKFTGVFSSDVKDAHPGQRAWMRRAPAAHPAQCLGAKASRTKVLSEMERMGQLFHREETA